MVVSCCAFGCTNRAQKDSSIHFFRFPLKNAELLSKWVNAMKRKSWEPNTSSRICSAHFVEKDYQLRPGAETPRLRSESVPSVFEAFPSYYQPKSKKPRLSRTSRDSVEAVIVSEPPLEIQDTPPALSTDAYQQRPSAAPEVLSTTIRQLRKKVKTLNQKVRRKNKKIRTLQELLQSLKKKGMTDANLEYLLLEQFSGTAKDIMVNLKKNQNRASKGHRYSEEMKKFALTLYYNSPRAYRYCRTILHLPHSSSLSNWLSNVDAEPGFLSNVFERLKSLNKIDKNCNLVIDGMAIRKQIIYCHAEKRFIGHCEFGQYLNVEASDVPATEALVFMLVGLKNAWKWPIAYFMQNKSNASLQCTLIKSALELSQQAGLKVHGITFDGTSTNVATLNSLGCNLHSNVSNINTQFTLNSKTVHAIPDPCHMMKLARNCLATLTKTKSPNGMIDWSYITKLHTLQENMGLKFADKLSRIHIEWTLNKMKVKLAAQTLSKSVADALEFLCKENVCGFEGSEETIRFIREIDRLFDFLNSTNPHNKGFKAPITNQNIDCLEKDILNILDYVTFCTPDHSVFFCFCFFFFFFLSLSLSLFFLLIYFFSKRWICKLIFIIYMLLITS